MLNQVCYRTLQFKEKPWSLENYLKLGGYQIWQQVLNGELSAEKIIEELKISNLRGRGGAGFPTGLKWSFMTRPSSGQKYIICNSDESEPGTCKDRDILRYNPHQILEGMLLAAFAMKATCVYNFMRGEFWEPLERMDHAVQEAITAGFIGSNIQNSGIDVFIYNVTGAGAYICGEETALMEALEGKKGMPRFKPPFPANFGLYGRPTNINNTETYASVPVILQKGGKWFADLGTPKSGGTKIFCMSGHVNKPGNYEVPLGTPFSELLEIAGGVRTGYQLKAVIPGGSSVPVVPADVMMKTNMDYESIAEAGSMLGAGSVIVMDNSTCMVEALKRISYFYYEESCGQCTPCREGTGWLYRVINRILNGQGEISDIKLLDDVAGKIMGRTICALGDAAAMPVISFIKHFRDEFIYHIEHKRCDHGKN